MPLSPSDMKSVLEEAIRVYESTDGCRTGGRAAENAQKGSLNGMTENGKGVTLEQENTILREKLKRQKEISEALERKLRDEAKETRRFREMYEQVFQEKAALEAQIAGDPKLPLDILLEIGGFVAGDNNYKTLLSLTMMSKTIKAEMAPILYETMFVWRANDLAREPGSGGRQFLAAYKYTKFVFTRHDSRLFEFPAIFPNTRLTVALHYDKALEAKGMATGVDNNTDFPA